MTFQNTFGIFLIAPVLGIGSVTAQEITPTPGTYELLEGKSMQFDAQQKGATVKAERYDWRIVSGEGAQLLNPTNPRVTFVAPSKLKEDSRNFTLQLTTHYPKGSKPSEAQINIRVHKKTKRVVARDRSPWLYGSIGFGFGYLWGGWWPYPPVIIIPPPPPGEIWPPEEIPPVAVPLPEDPSFDEWVANNPDIAQPYLEELDTHEEPLAGDSSEAEIAPVTADEPMAPSPELSIEPAPAPEPVVLPEPMDAPEPMDMPMDIPMDLGDF